MRLRQPLPFPPVLSHFRHIYQSYLGVFQVEVEEERDKRIKPEEEKKVVWNDVNACFKQQTGVRHKNALAIPGPGMNIYAILYLELPGTAYRSTHLFSLFVSCMTQYAALCITSTGNSKNIDLLQFRVYHTPYDIFSEVFSVLVFCKLFWKSTMARTEHYIHLCNYEFMDFCQNSRFFCSCDVLLTYLWYCSIIVGGHRSLKYWELLIINVNIHTRVFWQLRFSDREPRNCSMHYRYC